MRHRVNSRKLRFVIVWGSFSGSFGVVWVFFSGVVSGRFGTVWGVVQGSFGVVLGPHGGRFDPLGMVSGHSWRVLEGLGALLGRVDARGPPDPCPTPAVSTVFGFILGAKREPRRSPR